MNSCPFQFLREFLTALKSSSFSIDYWIDFYCCETEWEKKKSRTFKAKTNCQTFCQQEIPELWLVNHFWRMWQKWTKWRCDITLACNRKAIIFVVNSFDNHKNICSIACSFLEIRIFFLNAIMLRLLTPTIELWRQLVNRNRIIPFFEKNYNNIWYFSKRFQ